MKTNIVVLAALTAILLLSASAFGQTCQKMQMMGGETGDVKVVKAMTGCGMQSGMMGSCGMGGGMHGCSGMCAGMKEMCGGMMGEKGQCCKRDFFLCCKDHLELTDEQVTSLKTMRMQFLRGDIQKDADLKLAELELKELMSADKLDMPAVEKKIKAIHGMKADKKIAHLKAFEKAKGVLTPEQMEKKKEHHKKMMKGM
jgi:Spy/CpxP family protein refolding chaperone